MYRNTQVIVHLNHIRENVRKMKQAYPFYQYNRYTYSKSR